MEGSAEGAVGEPSDGTGAPLQQLNGSASGGPTSRSGRPPAREHFYTGVCPSSNPHFILYIFGCIRDMSLGPLQFRTQRKALPNSIVFMRGKLSLL